jgi:hypothetical protein
LADSCGKRPTTPGAKRKSKIAILHEEMDAIHHVNSLYWKQKEGHTQSEKAQYEFRQERLEKIRGELDGLRRADRADDTEEESK